jgi:hypothetical protein
MDTGFDGFEINPFKSVTGLFPATTVKLSFAERFHFRVAPVSNPRASRTSLGTVVWPFCVTVDILITNTFIIGYTAIPYNTPIALHIQLGITFIVHKAV